MEMRAALYLRVSTTRQAEKELSIPDQSRQLTAYCAGKGWSVAAEYTERGASGTNANRPELQRLMSDATRVEKTFDVAVVHSFSRFFRDAYTLKFHLRKREKHGARVASLTQETEKAREGKE